MAASSFTYKNNKKSGRERHSKLFSPKTRSHDLSVCGWCRCCWLSSLLLSSISHLTFCAASTCTISTTTTSSTPPLNPPFIATGGGGINANRRRILIALSVSALFLTWVFFMALFKYLRFKIGRKSKRVLDDTERRRGSDLYNSNVSPAPADTRCYGDLISKTNNSFAVRKFCWDEIERLSMNFSTVIDEGGFSTVYLAYFSDSTLGALKIHRNSERLNRLFKQELEILLHVRHHNIVKLLGYCDEREEGVLVFEYVPNRTLHEKLHGAGGGRQWVLPWKNRMSIAYQLAQAIEYLHENCSLQIVHGDIKASNVLLDEQLNCKLCDFGFAKMGFSSTVMPLSMSPLMGSPGYIDPHYMRTGISSKKNDVYSFGVMLLELITGIEAFCSDKEQLLTSIVRPSILGDANKVADIVDPRLAGDFDAEEATAMASISSLCLGQQPSLRPSMGDISRRMREQISSFSFANVERFKD